jgi:hypothetical protein
MTATQERIREDALELLARAFEEQQRITRKEFERNVSNTSSDSTRVLERVA